jgi:sulfite oxidase
MSKSSGLVSGLRRCVSSIRTSPHSIRISRCRPPLVKPLSLKRSIATKSSTQKARDPTSYIGPSILAAALVTCLLFYHNTTSANAEAPPISTTAKPTIRLADVKSHGEDSEEKWVVKGTKVYDITDWVSAHPGGEVILRAVGGTIDKYWDIFSIHKKQDVYDILESYYIGDLDPQDLVNGQVPSDDIDDPFESDPKRDPRLLVHSERPCNAEAPPECLNSFITPNESFYVRNHLWVPDYPTSTAGAAEKCKDKHTLHIELHDGTEADYTLDDLKRLFPPVTITATLQCSGNRRKHMSEGAARPTTGLPWSIGAISTSTFTGCRLRDVLAHAGFPVDDYPDELVKHAQFLGAEAYGASIPIDKAVSRRGDVLLVYEMGGQPLPRDHGYPLRALVPGHVAARSVKWLKSIVLSDEESSSQWQQRDYKCFGPNVGSDGVDWEGAPAIQEMPVQSAITAVKEVESSSSSSSFSRVGANAVTKADGSEESVEVQGYAFSGGGRRIVRVDVSADEGRTWHQAELLKDEAKGCRSWAWTRWKWTVSRSVAEQGGEFVVKAVDEVYNTQPERYEPQWNFRGNLTSGWHRVECPKKSRERKQRREGDRDGLAGRG